MELKESNAFHIILGESNKVYYYEGMITEEVKPELKVTNYSATGIRQALLQRMRANPETVVLIKPARKSVYRTWLTSWMR